MVAGTQEVHVGQAEEAVVRSFVDCLDANDQDGAVEHFSDDAVYHMVPWRKPVVGRDAIRSSFAHGQWVRSTTLSMASTDAVVFVEAVDTVIREGKELTIHYTMVLDINQEGKITAERDYWDTKEVDAQLA